MPTAAEVLGVVSSRFPDAIARLFFWLGGGAIRRLCSIMLMVPLTKGNTFKIICAEGTAFKIIEIFGGKKSLLFSISCIVIPKIMHIQE